MSTNNCKICFILITGILIILTITIGIPFYFVVVGIKDKIDSIYYNKEVDKYNEENKWVKDICYITYVSNITTDNSSFTFDWAGYVENNILNSSFSDFSREETEKTWNNVNKSVGGLPDNCYRNKTKTEISIKDRSEHRVHKEVSLENMKLSILLSILSLLILVPGWVILAISCDDIFLKERPVRPVNITEVVPSQDSSIFFVEIEVNDF